jgi:hypothetical protein
MSAPRPSPSLEILGGLAAIFLFSALPIERELVMGGAAIVATLLRPRLFIDWLRTLAKLTVFFASYLLLAWLVHTPAPAQQRFLIHVGFLLLVSVRWVRTIRLTDLHAELARLFPAVRKPAFGAFLHGVPAFLPVIVEELQREIHERKLRPGEALNILEHAFRNASKRIGDVARSLPVEVGDPPQVTLGGNWEALVFYLLVMATGIRFR